VSVVVTKDAKEFDAPVNDVMAGSTRRTFELGIDVGVVPTPITVEAGVGMQILLIL
jgi:hypothetical protein